jgi:putative peptidoglycan lipid II flippase
MIIAPGFSAAQQATTVRLLRILLLSPIIFGVSGIVMGILNAHQHFLLPALAPSVYNLAIIGGALLLSSRMGVMSLAVGAVVGSLLHLLVQVPGLLRFGARYSPVLDLRNPDVREVGRLMAPRVLGMAVVQLNFVINNSLASRMGVGAVSAINYAWLLMLLPQGVFAQAVGTAAFPTFADQVARGQLRELRAALAGTLRAVLFLSLPSTVGLLVLGRPLISLLFERGAFQASSTEAVAWALAFYALGLAWHALLEIVARAFYALHDTLTPVWVGGVAVAINVGLSLLLPPVFEATGWPPHGGLALANTVATVVEVTLLLVLIRRRLGGLEGRRTFATAAKSTLAALVMGGLLWGWVGQFSHLGAPLLSAAGILLGALVYLLASLLLRIEEPQRLFRMLLRRERPSVSSPNNVHR